MVVSPAVVVDVDDWVGAAVVVVVSGGGRVTVGIVMIGSEVVVVDTMVVEVVELVLEVDVVG